MTAVSDEQAAGPRLGNGTLIRQRLLSVASEVGRALTTTSLDSAVASLMLAKADLGVALAEAAKERDAEVIGRDYAQIELLFS